jgi:hypothetical protein
MGRLRKEAVFSVAEKKKDWNNTNEFFFSYMKINQAGVGFVTNKVLPILFKDQKVIVFHLDANGDVKKSTDKQEKRSYSSFCKGIERNHLYDWIHFH